MAEIIKFYKKDAAKEPDLVLEQAVGKYKSVLVIGWDKEDKLDARSDLGINRKKALELIECFKFCLLRGDYGIVLEEE